MNTYVIAACLFTAVVGLIITVVLYIKMDIKNAIVEIRDPQNKAIIQAAKKRKSAEKIAQEIGPQKKSEKEEPELEFLAVTFKEPEKWPAYDVEYIVEKKHQTILNSLTQEAEATMTTQPNNGVLLTSGSRYYLVFAEEGQ